MFRKADQKEFRTKPEKLAKEIIEYLLRKDMWQDTFIYVNGKRYGCYDGKNYHYEPHWDSVFVEDDIDPKKYCEYAGKILSISSEGYLYDALNYGFEWDSKVPEEFEALFKKYGYYSEACTSWFWTAAEL